MKFHLPMERVRERVAIVPRTPRDRMGRGQEYHQAPTYVRLDADDRGHDSLDEEEAQTPMGRYEDHEPPLPRWERAMMDSQAQFQHAVSQSIQRMADAITLATVKNQIIGQKPAKCDGTYVRDWLVQIDRYFNRLKLNDALRLEEVVYFLEGKALQHWAVTADQHPQHLPQNWTEFAEFMLARFCGNTIGHTLTKLYQLRFKGDFDELTEEFGEILSQGENPPQDMLVQLYLSRFPLRMVQSAVQREFHSWVEARDYMRTQVGAKQGGALQWFCMAPDEFRREAEADARLQREGWIPAGLANFRLPAPERTRRILIEEVRPREPRRPAGTQTSTLKCYQCQGTGHRARECPNQRLETKKEGQRCHKCGGVGHWASACPTVRGKREEEMATKNTHQEARNQGNGRA